MMSIFSCAYVLPIFLFGEIFSILFKYFKYFQFFSNISNIFNSFDYLLIDLFALLLGFEDSLHILIPVL